LFLGDETYNISILNATGITNLESENTIDGNNLTFKIID
jgi:hypothetical protein